MGDRRGYQSLRNPAQTFLENETGVIPEEHKEYIEDQLKILVRHHLSSSDECKTMLKNLLLNTENNDGDMGWEWFKSKVSCCLDEMMCERTRATIEEYNLVSTDNLSEMASEYLNDCLGNIDFNEYIDQDSISESACDAARTHLDDVLPDVVSENVNEQIAHALSDDDRLGELVTKEKVEEAVRSEVQSREFLSSDVFQNRLREVVADLITHRNSGIIKNEMKIHIREVLLDVLRG